MTSGVTARGEQADQVAAWAASGAMALTGWPGRGALGPPSGLVPTLDALAARLRSGRVELGVDPLVLLGERAAIAGLQRAGDQSCGGATRLIRSGDDWVAATLARPDDLELVPAWLGLDALPADVWAAVIAGLADGRAAGLVERAAMLGLPVALLPSRLAPAGDGVGRTLVRAPIPPATPLADLVVVDLSSLWAGPLCGSLLGSAGARVIKVESTTRPDGARLGPPAFFDLLNVGKQSVALDLRSCAGIDALRRLLLAADVVIEASRPRALEQLGIDAGEILASGRTRAWVSITGHGRTEGERDRVAFGDDAAVAGGLVCWTDDRPVFCADAIADPLTGMVATAAILEALAEGGRWLLDVPMAKVAASMAGPTLAVLDDLVVAAPRARLAPGRGPALGEHTAEVLAELAP